MKEISIAIIHAEERLRIKREREYPFFSREKDDRIGYKAIRRDLEIVGKQSKKSPLGLGRRKHYEGSVYTKKYNMCP